jgi:hypothetical protein
MPLSLSYFSFSLSDKCKLLYLMTGLPETQQEFDTYMQWSWHSILCIIKPEEQKDASPREGLIDT